MVKLQKNTKRILLLADASISFKTGNRVSYPMGYITT